MFQESVGQKDGQWLGHFMYIFFFCFLPEIEMQVGSPVAHQWFLYQKSYPVGAENKTQVFVIAPY